MTNRDRLVLAAGRLFYRNGYAATSVEDILERTGVARSNFYYHFGGKLDLAREVLRRWVDQFEEGLDAAERNATSPAERLERIFRQVDPGDADAADADAIPCPLGPLALELAPHDDQVRSITAELLDALRSAFRDVIARGAETGAFGDDLDPDPAAGVAVATFQGALLMCYALGDAGPLRQAEAALLDLLSEDAGAL